MGAMRGALGALVPRLSRGLSGGGGSSALAEARAEIALGLHMADLRGERGVIRLAGEDTLKFLQGLLTNDTAVIEADQGVLQYTSMLNPKGRFLHDMFVHSVQGSDGRLEVIADVHAPTMGALVKMLRMYKMRAQVDVADVSDDFAVHALFGGGGGAGAAAVAGGGGGGWREDPRVPNLGWRMAFPVGVPPTLPAGAVHAGPGLYRRWRVAWGVGEGGVEIPSGEALPLEYNLKGLKAINMRKGCYVGQELTARTHFRGVVRKRLMPVEFPPGVEVEVGAPVVRASGGKDVGSVRAVDGRIGLAHLRLAPAVDGEPLVVGGVGPAAGASIKPEIPSWWLPEWPRPEEPLV